MSTSLDALEERVSKLEQQKSGGRKFFIQYLLSPLLVVVVGVVFNWQLEQSKKEVQQIQIAQSMLTTLFSEDEFKALATKRLLDEVLEDENLKRELGTIITDYLQSKFAQKIEAGDIESAQKIVDAARAVGGQAGNYLVEQVESDREKAATLNNYQKARDSELQGFRALVDGNFDAALTAFTEAHQYYPALHSVAEIRRLLEANKGYFDSRATQQKIYAAILKDYAWKVPADIIEALKQKMR